MAASHNLSRLRDQTMVSLEDEEAVTVNTRALIDKVLARYSGEWTTLRELIQNAADAQAKRVTIRFETVPSATIPLPSTQDASEHIKHTILHHTLKTLVVSNDGEAFQESDWQWLKRIAEGNPDETKIGAFGVGFYSVFADCESPFVSSGRQSMAFYWKKDSLFTRRSKLADDQKAQDTTFLLDYRSQTTPVPQMLSICQFLTTSLTFVGLEHIELYLDDWRILSLDKKMAPGASVKIPSDVNPKTQSGLMKITDVEYQNAQIDATWMNVAGWDRRAQLAVVSTTPQPDTGISLRGFFGRFTSSVTNTTARKAQREEDALQQTILEDLIGLSKATAFLRISTVSVQTFVSKQLAQELERATKKPPPKRTRIAILTSSFDESEASLSTVSGLSSKKASDIFASVLPTKNGKIFIGFPTAQTTGLLAHISAPSVIPTVERESIDLNARWVRDWNIDMLRVAGIACRIAYTGEMAELKRKLERTMISNDHKKVEAKDIEAILPSAIHTYKQYNYTESTPSANVGGYIEEGFWTCNQKHSIDVLSTRGVLPSQQVRVATEHLSFVEGIPVIPDELMDKANAFLTKLRDYNLLSDITTSDIKKELEAQALTEKQVTELVKWACTKVSQQEMEASVIQQLFDGTIASISEEHLGASLSPVLQLGSINTFVNVAKIPAEMPTPPQTIPYRLTKGLAPSQLQSIGWAELQIVPWLRWIVESNGQGFPDGQSLTTSQAVAVQVLPVISKGWEGLSQSSKQTVRDLLITRTVIPTKLGMRKPPQSYFASVKLFDDLPTITGLQGVKEKFLSALDVRKTVELNVVFERLMSSTIKSGSGEESKWSHVDLIKYLITVKDDIPADDIKRLRQTPICPAEAADEKTGKGKLYRLSELYQPDPSVRKLGLPVLQWPGQFRAASPEGRFLLHLGLKPYPEVPDLVKILATAPIDSELQQSALSYWIVNAYQHGYTKYPVAQIDTAFLPVQPLAGESENLIAKPTQCFASPKATILRFRALRNDLQAHHAIFGVALNPPIDTCAQRLIARPPATKASARELFEYFAGRLNEIPVSGHLTERLASAPIVPVFRSGSEKGPLVMSTPRTCFLGDSKSYGDIFDFVDFGPEANTFLLRIGCKHEPNAAEIAEIVIKQPNLLNQLGYEKYLQLLRKIAEHAADLKKDKGLWQALKSSRCLLAEKLVYANAGPSDDKRDFDDEDTVVKEYSLAKASEAVLVDDIVTYRLFQAHLLAGPQEELLETLYASLEAPWLSKLVDNDQRMGQLLRDQSAGAKLQKLLVERCRLFLHDHLPDAIRHDARWLDQNLSVKVTEFLQVNRRLKGYNLQFNEKRTAALHRESKRDATLYITARYDLYEVSRALMGLLLKRPRQQDFLALETILESDLRRLKTKGYNVDRILRQKAAESRIAESEKQKREEEQRKLAAAEMANRPPTLPPAVIAGQREDQMQTQRDPQPQLTPEKPLSMPGAFNESPEREIMPDANRGRRPGGLFGSLSRHLGLNNGSQAAQQVQRMLSGNQHVDAPPPYEAQQPRGTMAVAPGTERVTSPEDLQANLRSAIKAAREYNSSSLFTQPQTREIKETPSYCDNRPGHDIKFIHQFSQGIKFYMTQGMDTSAGAITEFLQANRDALAQFVSLLVAVGGIFDLPPNTLNIYYDLSGASIAFNSNGSLFCNFRYFLQLHYAYMDSAGGQIEAAAYWWTTLCHELAHNLVSDHGSNHSFYTESFVTTSLPRMMNLAARVSGQQQQALQQIAI